MTRKQALILLRDKVTAGGWSDATRALRSWPQSFRDCAEPAFLEAGLSKTIRQAWSAYHGSLDAAKALHDAVLPGYGYGIIGPMSDNTCRACCVPKVDNPPEYYGQSQSPARAWLLAILEALIAQEPTP